MPRKLTNKQEAYKNNRIKGMGVKESYVAAYNTKNMSDKAISKEASKLETNPCISPVIKAKREEATERVLLSVEDVVRGLLAETSEEAKGSTQGGRVAAWGKISDYTGGFDANRQKIDMNGEVTFNLDFGGGK